MPEIAQPNIPFFVCFCQIPSVGISVPFGLTCVIFFVHFRCVPVCSAHMLCGPSLYVYVHGDSNLPIHTEETEVKRFATI